MLKMLKKAAVIIAAAAVAVSSMSFAASAGDSDYWKIKIIPGAPSNVQFHKNEMQLYYTSGPQKVTCNEISTFGTYITATIISQDSSQWTLSTRPIFSKASTTYIYVTAKTADAAVLEKFVVNIDTNSNAYSTDGDMSY